MLLVHPKRLVNCLKENKVMAQEDYIKTHPEQFKDDIDKWLFLELGIIGGCCSAEKSHEYHIARMVAEKLNDAFVDKALEYLEPILTEYAGFYVGGKISQHFKDYMKGE